MVINHIIFHHSLEASCVDVTNLILIFLQAEFNFIYSFTTLTFIFIIAVSYSSLVCCWSSVYVTRSSSKLILCGDSIKLSFRILSKTLCLHNSFAVGLKCGLNDSICSNTSIRSGSISGKSSRSYGFCSLRSFSIISTY